MKHSIMLIGGMMLMLLAACGPSAEQVATMTASAWTPSPLPPTATLTPTPIPYDLAVKVVDEQGNAISWAQVVIAELNLSSNVDETGLVSWNNLSQGNVTVRVTAQGYSKTEQQFALDRGLTETSVTLTREPFSLLPSQACAPGETLLYLEDFQDGKVDSWGTYPPGTPVTIVPDPAEAENSVLSLDFGDVDGEFQINTIPLQDNAARRLKYQPGNHSRFNVGWGRGDNGYFTVFNADEISLNYYSQATGEQKLAVGRPAMSQGVWHLMEFSSYNGKIEVWSDGNLVASYEGTSLTEGKILGIGSAHLPPDSIVHVDDISICGLNAPFAPMPLPVPAP